jgi:putative transposase
MPRLARAVAVGFAHHINQRGNNRQDVFFVDDDRRVYLELLKEQADQYPSITNRQAKKNIRIGKERE